MTSPTPSPLRVAVIGAGAVGCFYGGMLARAGHTVTLIGRPTHVDAIRAHGLRMQTQWFDEPVALQASTEASAVAGADVVLTDLTMPGKGPDGPELLDCIRVAHPWLPLVVLTGTASPTVLITLLRCGVHGALDKAADFDELAQAVRSAAAGQTYVSQHLRSHLQARDLAHRATPASLSQGERDVLEGLSRGMNLSMIAQQRGRSPKTVSRQKSDAMRKLGLTGNHELHAFLRTYPIKGSGPS